MKKQLTFLSILLIFKLSFVVACTCDFGPFNPVPQTFCETSHSSPIVKIVLTQIRASEDFVDAKVLDGDLPTLISIKEQDGLNCNVVLSNRNVGDTLVCELVKNSKEDYYDISACGINFLEVKNDSLVGAIAPGVTNMSYQDFKKTTCSKIVSSVDKEIVNIQVVPNPIENQVEIRSTEIITAYQLLDLQGKVIEEKINQSWKNKVLDVTWLTQGTYFLKLTSDEKVITKKLIKL